MLRGIKQTVFLGQWGMPELKTRLNDLKASFILDFLTGNIETMPCDSVEAWVYEKKDKVLFFKEEKLISHFNWGQFKARFKRPVLASSQIQDIS